MAKNEILHAFAYLVGLALWRKQTEEALRDLNRRLDEIIENSPDATVVVANTGTVIAWNKAIEEMTLVSKKDMN